MHVSRYVWKVFSEGEIDSELVYYLTLFHGLDCEVCTSEFQAYERGEFEATCWPGDDWTPSRSVERQLEELDELSVEQAVGKVERARTRFRGFAFLAAAIQKVRRLKETEDRGAMKRWGALLPEIADRTSGEGVFALKLLAQAEAGDLYRRLEDYDEAWRQFSCARVLEEGRFIVSEDKRIPRDPLVEGLFHLYRAQFLRERGPIPTALLHFTLAAIHIGVAGGDVKTEALGNFAETTKSAMHIHQDQRLRLLFGDVMPNELMPTPPNADE